MVQDDSRAARLAHFMLRKINKAVRDFAMIENGDRIAVALSGGKDSLSLLEMLSYRQRFARESYTLVAVHVVGDSRGPDMPAYPQLEEWLMSRGIQYMIRPVFVPEGESMPMDCSRCTWNRRRTIFEMADSLGCNKVAFGHHLDDLAETSLLNLIHHGRIETMAPKREYFGGKFVLIRPLAYIPEREIERFAATREFPAPPPDCPLGQCTQRSRMKALIAEMEKDCPKVRQNLVRAALRCATTD